VNDMEISANETRKVTLHVIDGPKITEDNGVVKEIRKVVFDTSIYGDGEASRWVYAYTDHGETIWNAKAAALRLLRKAGYDVYARDLSH